MGFGGIAGSVGVGDGLDMLVDMFAQVGGLAIPINIDCDIVVSEKHLNSGVYRKFVGTKDR